MDFGNIISNSFEYPFKDLKHLGFVFLLFVLPLVLPIGAIIENDITSLIGVAALFVFMLVAPGYMVSVVKSGIDESSQIPPIGTVKSIVNTFKLWILHICYITVPTIIAFLILSSATGLWNFSMNLADSQIVSFDVNSFFGAVLTTLVVTALVSWIFSVLSYIAKARLANYGSLSEALKIHKVLKDIRQIGIGRLIGWYIVIMILIALVRMIALLLLLLPYAGFAIYLAMVIPILSIIFHYSLGLLYSDFKGYGQKDDGDLDLEKFEKELEYLKYGRIH